MAFFGERITLLKFKPPKIKAEFSKANVVMKGLKPFLVLFTLKAADNLAEDVPIL